MAKASDITLENILEILIAQPDCNCITMHPSDWITLRTEIASKGELMIGPQEKPEVPEYWAMNGSYPNLGPVGTLFGVPIILLP